MDSCQPRNRIKELRMVPPGQLKANPLNWRKHGDEQRATLWAVLSEIGIAGACLARELPDGSLELIDGHLRTEEIGVPVPTLILDVDEVEANKILATLDPLAAMARTDRKKLKELFSTITMHDEVLQRLVGAMSENGKVVNRLTVPGAEPKHECSRGQVWLLGGDLTLCVADVFEDWSIYTRYLEADALLIPYAGPLVPFTEIAKDRPLVMVQPVPYVAGVMLDWWEEIHGADALERIAG